MRKSYKTPLLCVLLGSFVLGLTWRQDRNIKVVAKTADGKLLPLYKASYALVVGVANYTHGWPKLTEAVNDAREVKAALEQQGFLVTLVENPTAAQLRFALENFVATRGLDENNRLLFYFAGHGDTQKKSYGSDMGYIVAADAPLSRQDPTGFLQKALSMENFNTYAREINAKHVLFLFDSCFSGSIFALSRAVPDIISYKTSQPVRQFITAGSANEPVPDKSIFKQQFLAALQGEGDANRDGYVTGNELGEFLQTKVVNYSREAQHPQYGKIRDPKLDKGDFVFEVPVALPPEAKFDPSVYETEANRFAAAKAQWDKWQSAMNTGFQKTQSLDGNPNLTAASKAQMWQEFLAAYADNNPYSSEDETMRREANNRQNYWRAYQPAKEESAPKPIEPKITRAPVLRSSPRNDLSVDAVKSMLAAKGFADTDWNKGVSGFANDYELQTIAGEQAVVDNATGLMWQRGGSTKPMIYADAEKYIRQLNTDRFAGFNDWRLPTLEEAMSLMESRKLNGILYIDPKFDKKQGYIWTADKQSAGVAWVAFFWFGHCGIPNVAYIDDFVRAVRVLVGQ